MDLGDDTSAGLDQVTGQLEPQIGTDHPTAKTLRGKRRLLRALDPRPFRPEWPPRSAAGSGR